ncbi:hypothetical protein K492DRAFT_208260 [Lichtheimia hyalospora FSU 10163]|nr:hypothetical protein K492DRAFT_208260 [Lichtheimia hyalospora FSU 10163]
MSSESSSQKPPQQPQAQTSTTTENPLEPFYEQLLKLSFSDSVTAIEHCRDLCAQYGFTVKQEASAHRNIYVFCSREGQPDSQRKKSNPKRKRPSKRCDCRWRVVLHQQNGHWEFRKSLNPEAAFHNHELLRPEEVDRSWPQDVIDMIYELARTQLPTADIRAKVQAEFPDISWNERRFYNRLSEERQKIRLRETTARTRHLSTLWARICSAAAGSEELTRYVEAELYKLSLATCQLGRLDPQSLHDPVIENEETTTSSSSASSSVQQQQQRQQQSQSTTTTTSSSGNNNNNTNSSNKQPEAPKGFTSVVIPKSTYFIKTHNQRDRASKRQRIAAVSTQPTSTTTAAPAAGPPHIAPHPQPPQHQAATTPFVYQYGGMTLPTTTAMPNYEFQYQSYPTAATMQHHVPTLFDNRASAPSTTATGEGTEQQQQQHSAAAAAAAVVAAENMRRGSHHDLYQQHSMYQHQHQQQQQQHRLILPARTPSNTTNELLLHHHRHPEHPPETPMPGQPPPPPPQ